MFGIHIRQLSFTNDEHSSMLYCDLISGLTTCANVINLTLLTYDPLDKCVLEKILASLKHLKKLEITWSAVNDYPASSLKHSNLNEVSFYLDQGIFQSLHNYQIWIQDYISAGYMPQYVNIMQRQDMHNVDLKILPILKWWSDHSTRDQYRPPDGYTAHFKLYGYQRVPFNLSPTLPQLHMQFGLTPSVNFNNFKCYNALGQCLIYNVLGQMHYSLKLNYCNCNDLSCKCVVVSASVDGSEISYHKTANQYSKVNQFGVIMLTDDGLDYVGVSVNNIKSILDKDLGQLSFVMPHLQRLDLSCYDLSIYNMRGLCAVANTCHDLKGLNLKGSHVVSLNGVVLWTILSRMRLTHLSLECCLITSAAFDNQPKMANLYANLQAIDIGGGGCRICEECNSEDLLCLSHFSSLQYCRLFNHDSYHPNVVQDIATGCKKLKCIMVESNVIHEQLRYYPTDILLLSACNNCLEQLLIDSDHTIISDKFMESVSVHGGLVHVYLKVARITEKGVGILVENSPKLRELIVFLPIGTESSIPIILQKTCNYKKLVLLGYFRLSIFTNRLLLEYLQFNNDVLQDSDLFSFW